MVYRKTLETSDLSGRWEALSDRQRRTVLMEKVGFSFDELSETLFHLMSFEELGGILDAGELREVSLDIESREPELDPHEGEPECKVEDEV